MKNWMAGIIGFGLGVAATTCVLATCMNRAGKCIGDAMDDLDYDDLGDGSDEVCESNPCKLSDEDVFVEDDNLADTSSTDVTGF